MPEAIPFKSASKMFIDLMKYGAQRVYQMQYNGIVETGDDFEGKAVGPAAYVSKDKKTVLLIFEEDGAGEYALVQQDPEAENVISDFMGNYGHSIADLVAATPVHFTTSASAGGDGTITAEGVMTYGEEQASYYPDHYGVTGGDILNMNADDSQFLTVKASKMDSRSADVRAFAQLGGSMSGSNVGHMRIKGRVRGDAGRTVHAMVDMGDNWLAMAVFPATDTEWVDVEGPWFDVAALGLNFGYSDGGLAYGGISLHAPNGDVDVSKLEIEFTSF